MLTWAVPLTGIKCHWKDALRTDVCGLWLPLPCRTSVLGPVLGLRDLPAEPASPSRRFEQHLEQEQQALEQQRRRLYSEVAEERERLSQQAARCRQGLLTPLTVNPSPSHRLLTW